MNHTRGIHVTNCSDKQLNLLNQLFEQEYTSLWSFAYRYVEDKSEAEDLVQEAFICLWESLDGFNSIAAARVWLFLHVKNAALDHLRHGKVKDRNEAELTQWMQAEQNEPLERKMLEEEVFGYMYDAINKLPNQTRKILLLSLEGKSNPDIAVQLNISLNTLKTLKKKAYQQLRDSLGHCRMALLGWAFFMAQSLSRKRRVCPGTPSRP